MADIAAELGVSKSSVSKWTRDVEFEPRPRRTARRRGPNKLQQAKAAEIERCRVEGIERVGTLSEREFLMAGLGLYAGDGAKSGNIITFANSNPEIMLLFSAWIREFLDIDERRLRVRLYLHADLDLADAERFWSELLRVPIGQFHRPHIVPVSTTIRSNRHVNGCCHLRYASASEMRRILGMLEALLLIPFPSDLPG